MTPRFAVTSRLPVLLLAPLLAAAPSAASASFSASAARIASGSASAPEGQPARMCTPGGGARLAALADGSLYAAASCKGHSGVTVLRKPLGGSWVATVSSAWPGWSPVSVADDGGSTFVVVQKPGIGSPNDTISAIGKVPHGGRPSALTSLGEDETAPDLQVVARAGKWRVISGSHSYHSDQAPTAGLGQTGTLPGARTRPPSTGRLDESPSIALTTDGAVMVWVSREAPVDGTQPEGPGRLMQATAGADGQWTTRELPQAGGQDASYPKVVVSGSQTIIAWTSRDRAHLVRGDGPEQVLPAQGAVEGYSLKLAASGGRIFVTARQTLGSPQAAAIYRQAVASDGSVDTVELTATADPSSPHAAWGLSSAVAARGVPTAAFSSSRTVFSLSR